MINCGSYPNSWPDLQKSIYKYATEVDVIPDVHHMDLIFSFLINNPVFANFDLAVKYYFYTGQESADKLREILLSELCFPVRPDTSLLEFASGYGCVTRHLLKRLPQMQIVSCDIHPEAVEFLHSVFGVEAQLSTGAPEDLVFQKSFDAVFALSFFSHMPDHTWGRWLKTLYDATNSGGFLIFTTQGPHSRPHFGNPEIPDSGIWFLPSSEQSDLSAADYGNTIVTCEYVEKQVSTHPGAKICLQQPAAWWGHQDLYVVRKD